MGDGVLCYGASEINNNNNDDDNNNNNNNNNKKKKKNFTRCAKLNGTNYFHNVFACNN